MDLSSCAQASNKKAESSSRALAILHLSMSTRPVLARVKSGGPECLWMLGDLLSKKKINL